ncbi:MAG: TonB-dependent receptor [Acidobacteria bacterium]|nr:TonB-dependent receptor [Acidobacteriota bacterium]
MLKQLNTVRNLRRFFFFGVLGAVLYGALDGTSYAQTTAGVNGRVRDDSGAVLPGVTIVVESTETGRTQTVLSDDQGRYGVTGLPAGRYQITASLEGFKKTSRQGIELVIAQEALIDFVLQVGEIAEEVTVTGEAPIVDTTVSSVSGLINSRQMTELPLNGRDFTQLSLLETGTVNVRNTDQSVNKGFGTRVSVAGSRPDQTGYLLDGTSINGFLNFQAPGSVAGVILGVDAIREFRVEVSNFSAEYGRAAGGVFNMISKSGTNEIHGTLFEFHRNDNLDARNFFAIPTKPEFKRHQFGASLGGPIVKNQTFFFFNYEGLRQAKGLSFVGFVPDENARRGFLPAPGGGLREVGVASSVRPILDELYPLPNGANIGQGVATFNNSGVNDVRENYWVFKVDHQFSDRNRFFVRYNFDDGAVQIPFSLPNFADQQVSRYQYATLEENQTITPNLLNVLRFAYNRTKVRGDSVALRPISFTFRPGEPQSFAGIGVGGLSGTNGKDPRGGVQNLFQYTDNLYYTRGAHSYKFGFNLERVQLNDNTHRLGSFSFASLETFLRGIPNQLSEAELPGSDGARGWRQWYPAMYFQDDWRLSSHLTLNMGVRWEFYTIPTEVNGKMAVLRDVVLDRVTTIGDPFWKNPSRKDVSPRLGIAWDPVGDGKTVVRLGYGIFFSLMLPPHYRIHGARNVPFFNFTSVANPAPDLFPDVSKIVARLVSQGNVAGTRNANAVQFNMNTSYEQKFNLTLSRELFKDAVLTVGYLGGRGTHLLNQTDANRPVGALVNGRWTIPPGTPQRNPGFSQMIYTKSDGQSFYNALQIKLDRRLTAGLQARVSYTFSKNIDDGATSSGLTDYGGGGFAQNQDDPKAERGLSPLDSRHSFTSSWVYELPLRDSLAGMTRALLGGWALNGIVSLSVGQPFSVNLNFDNAGAIIRPTLQRPDLAPGASNNPIRKDNPDQYLDLSAFVVAPARTFGNLGRNTIMGPGYANMDLGLTKNTAIRSRFSENLALQFRAECFNIFNRAQFALPSVTIFSSRTAVLPTGGRISSTVGDSRQIQLGLKLIW